MTLTADQLTVQQAVKSDPRYFVENVLGAELYDKQIDIMQATQTHSRISVSGANGTGKDFTTARIVVWWLCSIYPSIVVVIAPTARQVHDIIWNELRYAYNNSRYPIGGTLFKTSRLYFDEQHFAIGFSTDDEFNIQGYHSPNLLTVVTEAHNVPAEHITALRRLNSRCEIMTGNPLTTSGTFYDSHHSEANLYHTVNISAFDTPNLQSDAPENGYSRFPGMVTKNDAAKRLEESNGDEDAPLYVAGVLGQFPKGLDDAIVPLWAVDKAVQRSAEVVDEFGNPESVTIACDVARFGKDKTVIVRRQGNHARIIHRVQGRDTMQIANWINKYIVTQEEDEDAPEIESVIIDTTGVGSGVTDRLNELDPPGVSIVEFNGGAKASDDEHYANATSEAWMLMRKWFMEEEADIENDGPLKDQLTSRDYSYQGDRRIIIESKTKMAKSPDEADALAMTFAGGVGPPKMWTLEW